MRCLGHIAVWNINVFPLTRLIWQVHWEVQSQVWIRKGYPWVEGSCHIEDQPASSRTSSSTVHKHQGLLAERRRAISGRIAACPRFSHASTLHTIGAGSILQAIRSSHRVPSATSWYTLTVARCGVVLSDWNNLSSALTMRSPIGTSLTSNQRRRPLSCRNPLWWASPADIRYKMCQ